MTDWLRDLLEARDRAGRLGPVIQERLEELGRLYDGKVPRETLDHLRSLREPEDLARQLSYVVDGRKEELKAEIFEGTVAARAREIEDLLPGVHILLGQDRGEDEPVLQEAEARLLWDRQADVFRLRAPEDPPRPGPGYRPPAAVVAARQVAEIVNSNADLPSALAPLEALREIRRSVWPHTPPSLPAVTAEVRLQVASGSLVGMADVTVAFPGVEELPACRCRTGGTHRFEIPTVPGTPSATWLRPWPKRLGSRFDLPDRAVELLGRGIATARERGHLLDAEWEPPPPPPPKPTAKDKIRERLEALGAPPPTAPSQGGEDE